MATYLRKQPKGSLQELQEFAKAHPAYFDHALACVKAWGDGERQLQHCIAIALLQMWEMGKRGQVPPVLGLDRYTRQADAVRTFAIDCKPAETPAPTRVMRTPPAPPPVQRVTRTRP